MLRSEENARLHAIATFAVVAAKWSMVGHHPMVPHPQKFAEPMAMEDE